jgi:hypothetical protein
LPTAGVALAVNDGDDRDKIREDAIDDQIVGPEKPLRWEGRVENQLVSGEFLQG